MGIFTLDKSTLGIYPWLLYDCYYSEFNSNSLVMVLHPNKDKFTTKIACVKGKILPSPTLQRHACDKFLVLIEEF